MPGLGTAVQVGISSLVLSRNEISPKLGSLHNTSYSYAMARNNRTVGIGLLRKMQILKP